MQPSQAMAGVLRELERLRAREIAQGPGELPLLALTPECARLLAIMLRAQGARRVLEIGCSWGYSTCWIAWAVGPEGSVETLELSERKWDKAREYLARAGLLERVRCSVGDARQTIARHTGPYDCVFLDAGKDVYLDLLTPIWSRLRPGGLLVADNLRSHADELRSFRDAALALPDGFGDVLEVGSGMLLATRDR